MNDKGKGGNMDMVLIADDDRVLNARQDKAEAEIVAPEATAAERGLVAFTQLCTSCHLIEGVNDATYTGADQVSGAAPNLTHFASRTTFAGGLVGLAAGAAGAWLVGMIPTEHRRSARKGLLSRASSPPSRSSLPASKMLRGCSNWR